MTLGRFISGFGNPNVNYNILGQLTHTPHGSSGTAILQPPQPVEVPDSSKGDCFTITTQEDKCFTLSVVEEDCFKISIVEEDKEIASPPSEITVAGFSTIKCIQSHGLFNLAVVGMYRPSPNEEERAVLAKVHYDTSAVGGVGSVIGVTYYENLSYYDDLTIEEVDRLDGWDIQKENSPICMVLSGGETIWIGGGALLEEENRQPDGGGDPFYTETTYAPTLVTADDSNGGWHTREFWNYRSTDWIVYNYSLIDSYPRTLSNTKLFPKSMSTGELGAGELATGATLGGTGCVSTGACTSFTNCMQEVSNGTVLSGWLYSASTSSCGQNVTEGYTLRKKRNGFTIVDTPSGMGVTHSENFSVSVTSSVQVSNSYAGYPRINTNRFINRTNTNVGNAGEIIPFIDSGNKLCFDGEYYGCVTGTNFNYTSADGSKSGAIEGVNGTLIGGVLLQADGTSQITQTVLDDVE